MKIIQLPPYYTPEQISSSHLTEDLEKAFVEAGYDMEIYAPTPTRGVSCETRSEYRKKKREEKYNGKIVVRRFSMFREGRNPFLRALRYVLCNIVQYFKGIRVKNADILMAGSTPPTQGLLCGLVKKRLKIPFIYNLQDIFPDSLVSSGLTHNGSLLWKIGRRMEKFTYHSADKIIVISEAFRQNLLDKGVPEEKIAVIPNWVDCDVVKPVSRAENSLFEELQLDRSGFYVTYAGNLGEAQGIDTILSAAALLEDRPDIQFILFGGGPNYAKYEQHLAEKGHANVRLFPLQPPERISEVYSLGNVSLVACKKGLGAAAMPSKTWSIMAAGCPVLAVFDRDSELDKLLTENACGVCVEPDAPEALRDAVVQIYNDQESAGEMGTRGRRYVVENLSTSISVQKYIEVIAEIADSGDSS